VDVKTSAMGDTIFRPEIFFVGRTEGSGIVRDAFGRAVRRCEIVTAGSRQASYGALQMEETFTYDDGEVDVWRWVVTAGGDGRYMASEQIAGSGIIAHREGDDYVLNFNRPVGKGPRWLAPRYATRFSLLSPDIALKTAKVSLFGAPLGVMTGIHRRLAEPTDAA
jgi:hypothetical protein